MGLREVYSSANLLLKVKSFKKIPILLQQGRKWRGESQPQAGEAGFQATKEDSSGEAASIAGRESGLYLAEKGLSLSVQSGPVGQRPTPGLRRQFFRKAVIINGKEDFYNVGYANEYRNLPLFLLTESAPCSRELAKSSAGEIRNQAKDQDRKSRGHDRPGGRQAGVRLPV